MKISLRMAVVVLCLLSLFGCGKKDRHILDGPGMVREVTWQEFTLSQQSDVYEENYSLTVRWDQGNDAFYLYVYTIATAADDPEPIRLKSKTVNRILSMDFLGLPNEQPSDLELEILDGTFSDFQVIDQDGVTYKKVLSYEMEQELKQLLLPYRG